MRVLKLGATALAGVFLAGAVMAAPALAQTPPAGVQLSKGMVTPMNEARNALIAKDFTTAKTKLDAAAGQAKTPQDKMALDRLRLVLAAETKNYDLTISTVDSMLASGLLTPDEVKQSKGTKIKAYADKGDEAKSAELFRAFIDEYGGTPEQLASIANTAARAGDNATGLTYINKAIAAAKQASGKAPEGYYLLLLRIYRATNDMNAYYQTEGELIGLYPKESYWKEFIVRAQKEPTWSNATGRMDLFRTLQAAGVKLTPQEIGMAAQAALDRGLPNEALTLLEPAVAAGAVTSTKDTDNLKSAQSQVASDKAGLAKETADTLAKGDGAKIASIGEAQLSYGDNAKAIEVLQAALTKGIANAGDADFARLHLGIAQYRAGQKDAALATWAQIKADNGAAVFAQTWTLVAKQGS